MGLTELPSQLSESVNFFLFFVFWFVSKSNRSPMVHFISSGLAETMKDKGSKKAPVKPEIDDSSEPLEPLHKRTKLDLSPQVYDFSLRCSNCNSLKTFSFLVPK